MNNYTVHINIMPLTELLDPQGKAVHESLDKFGFSAIENVRIGKRINLQIQANTSAEAKEIAENACKKLLYNAVMEQFEIEVIE